MSAELLREAAALMRERAEAANEGPWGFARSPINGHYDLRAVPVGAYEFGIGGDLVCADAEHIASWHPAVALAVAKALDDVAQAWENCDGWTYDFDEDAIRFEDTVDGGWLAVARAYLGRDA